MNITDLSSIKVIDLDITTPIDVDQAVSGLGGEPAVFYGMLGQYESMTLNQSMKDIVDKYDNLDYAEFKNIAHSLKGSCGYVGAGKLHYACYFIQENYVLNRTDKEMEFYPSLVEAAIEFKTHSRMLIEKYNRKSNTSISYCLKLIKFNSMKNSNDYCLNI